MVITSQSGTGVLAVAFILLDDPQELEHIGCR